MKISLLVNYLGTRGAGPVYALEVAKEFLNKGCAVVALIPSDIENFDKWKESGIDLVVVESYQGLMNKVRLVAGFIFGNAVRSELLALEFTHIYSPMLGPFTYFVNRLFDRPQIITTLHDPIPHPGSNFIVNILNDIVCRKSDYLVILSQRFTSYCVEKFRLDPAKVITLRHPMFGNARSKDVLAYNFNHTKEFNFLFIGRIEKYKGLEIFLDACLEIQKLYSNFSVSIVGSGNLSKFAAKIDQIDNIDVCNRWLDNDEIPGFFLRPRTITVLPYTSGTQSGIIPLAMAHKSFIICSNIDSLADQLNGHGLLVEPNDANSLSEGLGKVLSGEIEFDQDVISAFSYINTQTWSAMVEELLLRI